MFGFARKDHGEITELNKTIQNLRTKIANLEMEYQSALLLQLQCQEKKMTKQIKTLEKENRELTCECEALRVRMDTIKVNIKPAMDALSTLRATADHLDRAVGVMAPLPVKSAILIEMK